MLYRFIKTGKSCALRTAGAIVFAAAFLFVSNTEAFGSYLEREYKDMDADRSGYVNLNEFKFYETKGADVFNEIDGNSNGRIEFWEWTTFRDRNYPFESRYRDRKHLYRYKRFPGHRDRFYPYPRYGLGFRFGYGLDRHRPGYFFDYHDRFPRRYGRDWHPYRGRFW